MKQGSTWFLRSVIVLMGLVALAVCIFALPSITGGAAKEFPGANNFLYLMIGGLYFSAVPFFLALYQGLKLLSYIDKNQAFSQLSVSALKVIKYCGIVISVCYAAGIPYLFHVAELDDAPGLGLIALAFTCIPLVVATFAAVLQKLFQNALTIKSENDLTV
ncbi:MAG: DUF2975 domain-containing protein [Candidatus Doudnabacteria bacterium]|nr:DUF2975 domain-containing protein [Candidatus Doudnabacteria bacterium]